ncbi:MAG: alpha-glucosidase [Bacteroidetes bacterium HGW-Bacteroidetes-6]|jgi:alpha-glucosidase|nr:MAG: alpha-glucosidase [Bacteroidetes bacterium HGW-Bacteroidetes-6]
MIRWFLLFLLLPVACFAQNDMNARLNSPDSNVVFNFSLISGVPAWTLFFYDNEVIEPSTFSFQLNDQPDLGKNLICKSSEISSSDEYWGPVWGTDAQIRNHYNQVILHLQEADGLQRKINFVVRVYNDGIGFRYEFPEWPSDSILIVAENTEFRFSRNDSAWWIPSNEFAYESLYRHTLLSEIADASTPVTIVSNNYCISIHEAELLDYSEIWLKKLPDDSTSFVSSLWSWPDGICVRGKAPFRSPWRSIMLTRTPGELIESHLTLNLNEPCVIEDVSWIKPMKFVGIWWGMHMGKYTWYAGSNHGATTKRTKQYIDFAAKHGIGGVLAEGWNLGWETWATDSVPKQDFCTAYPDFDLKKVVKYAKSKNVEFISHHETGGNIPEYERQLDSAMALCNQLGITSLKTGYAGPIRPVGMHHHGQYMVRHFQKVVETAAFYHITLNVHESIKPTGLDRTWPNLMTQEAVRGNEWNATYRATPPYHSTILPFTRMLAGPFDNTPGIVHVNYAPGKNKRLYCTATHQAAMYVVFYSPLMMLADLPENYEESGLIDFISSIPNSWDQTIVPAADPGNYVCVARRKDNKWYMGALADENSYLLKIPMSFLSDSVVYRATMANDCDATDWENNPEDNGYSTLLLQKKDTVFIPLSKAGGFIMHLTPCPQISPNAQIYGIEVFNKVAIDAVNQFMQQKTYGNTNISHKAVGAQVSLKNRYSQLYPASGNNAICDGELGSLNFSDGGWQGFEGDDLEATLTLPDTMTISKIEVRFLLAPNDWIFLPKNVAIYVSSDGINFVPVQDTVLTSNKPKDIKIVDIQHIVAEFDSKKVKYIKIVAENQHICPMWHYARGNKAWMFCDEIIVR